MKKTLEIRENAEICNCMLDICPECVNDEVAGLWLNYYEQYGDAIDFMVDMDGAEDCILPLLNLVSTYIELWAKAIGLNYGMGGNGSVQTELFIGHKLLELMWDIEDIVSVREFTIIEDDFLKITDIIEGLLGLTAEESISLSEATRYPETKKRSFSLDLCFASHLIEMCDKFSVKNVIEDIRELMILTREVFDKIYELRIIGK